MCETLLSKFFSNFFRIMNIYVSSQPISAGNVNYRRSIFQYPVFFEPLRVIRFCSCIVVIIVLTLRSDLFIRSASSFCVMFGWSAIIFNMSFCTLFCTLFSLSSSLSALMRISRLRNRFFSPSSRLPRKRNR